MKTEQCSVEHEEQRMAATSLTPIAAYQKHGYSEKLKVESADERVKRTEEFEKAEQQAPAGYIDQDDALLSLPPGTELPEPNDKGRYIEIQREKVVKALALLLRRGQSDGKTKELLERLDIFLLWLANRVTLNPMITRTVPVAQLKTMLELIYDDKVCKFPDRHAQQARLLYKRWEAEEWGQPPLVFTDQEDNKPRLIEIPQYLAANEAADMKPVPADDRVWGIDGVMYGAALSRKGQRVFRPDLQKRDFKVYGNNGLVVGRWWPYQMLALMHGAHGSMIGGISGSSDTGAYSVVVSGEYSDLDEDFGNKILYSGSNSHGNRDPDNTTASTNATNTLKVSLKTGRPVRVLRGASQSNTFCPSKGIRYDGLYHVTSMTKKRNQKGGLFEQFKLNRLPEEPSLATIITPTSRQLRDLAASKNGY